MHSPAASSATCARSSRPGTSRRISSLAWDEPGWLADATRWIDAHVARSGDVEIERTRAWSAIARVPTASGLVWFKECAQLLAFEPALTAFLARRRPDDTPAVLATEGPRMLTAHVGPQLRELLDEEREAPEWEGIVQSFAQLQADLARDAGDLVALGTPERAPESLPDAYAELVERWRPQHGASLTERIRGLVDELGAAVPITIAHEEVHDGNVVVREGRPILIDWGEACVSHPFFALVNTVHRVEDRGGGATRVRDAYLEHWTEFATMPELRRVFRAAYELGHVSRLRTWDAILRPFLPARWEHPVHDPIEGWFEQLAEAPAHADTLGL